MKPYYQDDAVTIYHGDCREILPELPKVDLLLTDPPYGIEWDTEYNKRGMGGLTQSYDYPPITGDKDFEPSHLLKLGKCVLFGANHYADKLPPSAGWIVWDKTGRGRHISNLSDAELAWTNIIGSVRIFSHLWKGMLKDSECNSKRVHPTQKPVALFKWIISKWTKDTHLILDPYLGSGPVLRAAKDLGRKAIGIEIEEKYCEIAARRMIQEVLNLEAGRGV